MLSFFGQVAVRPSPRGEALVAEGNPVARHPRTGAAIPAYALGTKMPTKSTPGDRRRVLADWMTGPENAFFARNLVNRYWAHFTGRGLVEPVDDVRDTNPPSNPELLDALAKSFIESKYDVPSLSAPLLPLASINCRRSRTRPMSATSRIIRGRG